VAALLECWGSNPIFPTSPPTTTSFQARVRPRCVRYGRLKRRPVETSRSDRCQAAGLVRGELPLRAVWFGYDADQNRCCATSSSQRPWPARPPWWGRREPARSTPPFPVAALQTPPSAVRVLLDRPGPGRACRAGRSAPCHRPLVAPAEATVFFRTVAEAIRFRTFQPAASRCRPGSTAGQMPLTSSKPWPGLAKPARIRGAGQQIFPAVPTATAGIAPGPCSGNPAVLLLDEGTPAHLWMLKNPSRRAQGLSKRWLVAPCLVIAHAPRHRAGSRTRSWCSRPVHRFEQGKATTS